MIFTTLKGNNVPLALAPYRIKWKQASLSKFQTRIKNFFEIHFRHLDWYEEVPLVGAEVNRLRWDFLCTFETRQGKLKKIFVEVQGSHHDKLNPKFQKDLKAFEDQTIRDQLKVLFAAKNSDHNILYFYEDDPPLTLEWFKETFPNILPLRALK